MSCYSIQGSEKPLAGSSEFCITPGPSHLHSPLGHSDEAAHNHYIQPTANFTTEYEDAFRDPSPRVGTSDPKSHILGSTTRAVVSWADLQDALQKIIDHKFEVSVATKAMKQLQEHRLADDVEDVCAHFNEVRTCEEISEHLHALLNDFSNKVTEFKK